MSAEALTADDIVLVLSTDDRWLFVGTVAEVLHHAGRHRGTEHMDAPLPDADRRTLDFYDSSGRRLQPMVDESLDVHGFTSAGGRAAPVTIRRRIDRVLAAARDHLTAHPPTQQTMYPPGTIVPEVSGELDEVLDQLRAMELRPDNAHKRGWFHNLLHAMG